MADITQFFGKEFNSSEHKAERNNFTPIPRGIYDVEIIDANVRNTSQGNGTRISVCYSIIGGDYEARKLFQNFNIVNKSSEAERIGREQFSSLCDAAGLHGVRDTDDLVQKTLTVRVGIKDEQNIVTGHMLLRTNNSEISSSGINKNTQKYEQNTKPRQDSPWSKR